jgi:hypothetical protein
MVRKIDTVLTAGLLGVELSHRAISKCDGLLPTGIAPALRRDLRGHQKSNLRGPAAKAALILLRIWHG